MKIEDIERLIRLVSENDLESFEMKSGGMEIRITREGVQSVQQVVHQVPIAPAAAAAPTAVEAVAAPVAVAAPAAPAPAEKGGATTPEEMEQQPGIQLIRSTMVGTLYRSPAPGADPFARVGGEIRKGQIICIIEAMKIMNEIEAEISGEVKAVFVEDGQPVEYGEPIMAVATA